MEQEAGEQKEMKKVKSYCKMCGKMTWFVQAYFDEKVFVCGNCGYAKKLGKYHKIS